MLPGARVCVCARARARARAPISDAEEESICGALHGKCPSRTHGCKHLVPQVVKLFGEVRELLRCGVLLEEEPH